MVALPNPSFEPKTHRWRPGAGAPSREVPSQICAVLGQKEQFLPKTTPKPGQNAQTKGYGEYTARAASLHRVKELSSALQLHDMSEKRPKNAPKRPKICAMCTNPPKPSTGRILGSVAQNSIPRAPSPPATPHFLWFPSLRIAQRDTQTPEPVVTWCSRWAPSPAHGGGQRWVHQGPQGEKNHFFQSCS